MMWQRQEGAASIASRLLQPHSALPLIAQAAGELHLLQRHGLPVGGAPPTALACAGPGPVEICPGGDYVLRPLVAVLVLQAGGGREAELVSKPEAYSALPACCVAAHTSFAEWSGPTAARPAAALGRGGPCLATHSWASHRHGPPAAAPPMCAGAPPSTSAGQSCTGRVCGTNTRLGGYAACAISQRGKRVRKPRPPVCIKCQVSATGKVQLTGRRQ